MGVLERFYTANQEFNRIIDKIREAFERQSNIFFKPNLGVTVMSELTEDQFQTQYNKNWILCDGRNIAGSALQRTFAVEAVPNLVGHIGLNFFIKIN